MVINSEAITLSLGTQGTTMITIRRMMTVALAVAALATASIVASGDASARGGRGGGGGFHAGGGFQGAGLRSGFQGMGSRHVGGMQSQARRPGRPGGCRRHGNCDPGNPPGQGPGHGHGHGKRHFGVGLIGLGFSSCLQITPSGLVDVCE